MFDIEHARALFAELPAEVMTLVRQRARNRIGCQLGERVAHREELAPSARHARSKPEPDPMD